MRRIQRIQRTLIIIMVTFVVVSAGWIIIIVNSPQNLIPSLILIVLATASIGTTIARLFIAVLEARESWLKLSQVARRFFISSEDSRRIDANIHDFVDDRKAPPYIERSEGIILREMKKSRYPKLIEIIGPTGAGKKRMIRYMVHYRLIDHYRGRVIFFSQAESNGNLTMTQMDELLIKHIASIVSEEDDIRTDSQLATLNDLQAYFHDHPKKSWLIFIVADVLPSAEILSRLFGSRNTLVVAHTSALASQEQKSILDASHTKLLISRPFRIQPFNSFQAIRLFRSVIKGAYIHPRDLVILRRQLRHIYPSSLIQLALAYKRRRAERSSIYPQGERGPILAEGDIGQLGDLFIQQLMPNQQILLTILAIFSDPRPQKRSAVILEPWVQALFLENNSSSQILYKDAVHICQRQGLLISQLWQHGLALTPYGSGIAHYILDSPANTLVADVKVQLITHYREEILALAQNHRSVASFEIHQVLAAWSVIGLNKNDTVLFSHTFRDLFYSSGELDLGYRHLQEAIDIASQNILERERCAEMAVSIIRIALALKQSDSARKYLNIAHTYYEEHRDETQLKTIEELEISVNSLGGDEMIDSAKQI